MQYEINKFDLATDLILNTKYNVFLTGKAGTGKTTFLRGLLQECTDKHVVAAPTGIAAINARGVTIHSLFQLPFHPFLPDSPNISSNISETNKIIIKELELLIIDEISMVRADVLDAIDYRLRTIRKNPEPFGGVQLLLIGDLFQLPPVAVQEEYNLLKDYYDSMFFFDSKALKKSDFVTVELDKIFRQDDKEFKDILNSLREGNAARFIIERLSKRYIPDFKPKKDEPYIRLVTHNAQANKINREEMENLDGKKKVYEASIVGEFPESSYPVPSTLTLKVGAHVMTTKNKYDGYFDHGIFFKKEVYYNGSLGIVTAMNSDSIDVKLLDGSGVVKVETETWDNIIYKLEEVDDVETNGRKKGKKRKIIVEECIGSFTQFPLRPAWAITIHKSQGLTFDRAIIDVRRSFMAGQTYVALSRCRSLDGIVLSEKIDWRAIKCDKKVKEFYQKEAARISDIEKLDEMRRDAYLKSLHSNLDVSVIEAELVELIKCVMEYQNELNVNDINTLITAHRDFSIASGIRTERYLSPIDVLINETKVYSQDSQLQATIYNVAKHHLDNLNKLADKLTVLESRLNGFYKTNRQLDVLKFAVILYRSTLEFIIDNGFSLLESQRLIKKYDINKHNCLNFDGSIKI